MVRGEEKREHQRDRRNIWAWLNLRVGHSANSGHTPSLLSIIQLILGDREGVVIKQEVCLRQKASRSIIKLPENRMQWGEHLSWIVWLWLDPRSLCQTDTTVLQTDIRALLILFSKMGGPSPL